MEGLWGILETVIDKANNMLSPFFRLLNSTVFWIVVVGFVVVVVGLAAWVGVRVLLVYVINAIWG